MEDSEESVTQGGDGAMHVFPGVPLRIPDEEVRRCMGDSYQACLDFGLRPDEFGHLGLVCGKHTYQALVIAAYCVTRCAGKHTQALEELEKLPKIRWLELLGREPLSIGEAAVLAADVPEADIRQCVQHAIMLLTDPYFSLLQALRMRSKFQQILQALLGQ